MLVGSNNVFIAQAPVKFGMLHQASSWTAIAYCALTNACVTGDCSWQLSIDCKDRMDREVYVINQPIDW